MKHGSSDSPKIYADFNNADSLGRLRLNCNGAQGSLRRHEINLQEGMVLRLTDEEEFEALGIVMHSKEENIWVAQIDWNEIIRSKVTGRVMPHLQAAREKIIELCSEDDYGSWELFWGVSPFFKIENQHGNAETIFVALIDDLISKKQIVSLIKNQATDQLEAALFDKNRLAIQLEKSLKPEPDSFYWFGLPSDRIPGH